MRVLVFLVLLLVPLSVNAATCDYYASPTGTNSNNGLTPETPIRPGDFWALARPGKTLCLLDGVYRGAAFMLAPSEVRQPVGTQANPITIRAMNDGKVLIDGQGAHRPFRFMGPAKWVVFEGFNVCCSSEHVIDTIRGVQDLTFRRMVAWDARDYPDNSGDSQVWYIVNSHRVLLEDVAGFGIGRKILQPIISSHITVRRGWFRYEGYRSTLARPRATIHACYKSTNQVLENVLGTWSAEYSSAGTPYSVFHAGCSGPERYFGNIAYVKGNAASFEAGHLVGNQDGTGGDITIQDMVAFIEPKFFPTVIGFDLRKWLGAGHGQPGPYNLTATRLSFWGGSGVNRVNSVWAKSEVCASATFPGSCPNPFTGANGANVCKRYVDGTLTGEPLWPWPMDERIKAALAAAGRSGLAGGSVTAEIESLLGPIPAICRSDRARG